MKGGNVMYIPLGVKSDYSLLKSLIKIPDLMKYLKDNNITACGLIDDNLFGSKCFYDNCLKNDIKPIIGLSVSLLGKTIYLYAKNYEGYLNLLKVNSLIQNREVNLVKLKLFNSDLICVVPFKSIEVFDKLREIYSDLFISYQNDYEKNNAIVKHSKIVYLRENFCYDFSEVKYLGILREIDLGVSVDLQMFSDSYLAKDVNSEDEKTTMEFASLINLTMDRKENYIPHFDEAIKDSYAFLALLCQKGLNKRLKGNITESYQKRLNYELDVIKQMGFVDYFLIVYDYVKFAKNNDILVGPGRGSAAGSLVSYAIGITNVDPLKYELLFERFLNPERITMPDIDIDFEYSKRDKVINYVKERYGVDKVANIMTFGTFAARQVIRDVGKCLKVDLKKIDTFANLLNPKETLEENLSNKSVKNYLNANQDMAKVYQIGFKIEGLKRHISTHAAGVVICSKVLDEVIPICKSGNELLTGFTMEYLEDLGLLKMDFLALRNLSIIKNVLDLITEETGKEIILNDIPLNDKKTLELFRNVDTEGIFQFESSGMKNFLTKLQVQDFNDLVAALALFRPGPMKNIDVYIRRKERKEKVTYPDDSLEDILADTYGIMIYQEQIMQILVKMGSYSFSEADNIRRAISKKKKEVMEKEREVFAKKAIANGYSEEKALEVYDLILKFADYGFNKAHSVSYAIIGYQMAYLKCHYPVYFMANLLNMSIGSSIKTKEYIDEAKRKDISVFKPNINVSMDSYVIKDRALLLPLSVIANVGEQAENDILKARESGGRFKDFFDFVARVYRKSVNKKTIEALIDADCFRSFNLNHKTLYENLDSALDYASLCSDLDESLVMRPTIKECVEFSETELMNKEIESFGFFVTNHPASKYQKGIMKIKDMVKFFDEYVETVALVSSIRKIKTKNGEEMAFVSGNDETDSTEFIVFPRKNEVLTKFKKGDLVKFRGQVVKRFSKYQIVVTSVENLS